MLRFKVLSIVISEHTKLRVEAAEWEVPILIAVHNPASGTENDAANVEEIGELLVDRDPPDAKDEFRRLAQRYRNPEGSDIPFVAAVYGQFGVGTLGLAKAIADAVVDAPEAADEAQDGEAAPASAPAAKRGRKTKPKDGEVTTPAATAGSASELL